MLAETVGGRLRKEQQKASMVSVEIKYSTFQSVSHQKQIARATNTDQVIYENACELFHELWNGESIRLLGIRTSKLQDDDAPEQMSIFDYQDEEINDKTKEEKYRKLDHALDEIRKKFGDEAIQRGIFLK